MPTTLNGILEAIEAQLVLKVTKLATLNVEIATDAEGYEPRVSKYGAVIFGCGFSADGFKGGLEFKVVQIDIAFIHKRSTDVSSEDPKAIEMRLTEVTEQALPGLPASALCGGRRALRPQGLR